MKEKKVAVAATHRTTQAVRASSRRFCTSGPLDKLGLQVGRVGATPTLTSHLSSRQVPKHLSGLADGWAWNGLVCRPAEARQLFNSPASDPGQDFQGRKRRRIECPLNVTTKAVGGGTSSPWKWPAAGHSNDIHTNWGGGSTGKGGGRDQNCSLGILAWPSFP